MVRKMLNTCSLDVAMRGLESTDAPWKFSTRHHNKSLNNGIRLTKLRKIPY